MLQYVCVCSVSPQAIYERLFQLVVDRINKNVNVRFAAHAPKAVIGVVDIYGFEVFGVNG